MSSAIFKELVEQVEPNYDWDTKYSSTEICDDRYVGTVCTFGCGFDFIGNDFDYQPIKNTTKKMLVLVLESPHKEEFNSKNELIQPARGLTGKNIRKLLLCATHGISNVAGEFYDLVLINAVQN